MLFGRRLKELEEETSALKSQLLSASPAPLDIPIPSGSAAPPLRQDEDTNVPRIPTARIARRDPSTDKDPTLSRTIDGLEFASDIIDDCFEL
jgi:hypothetical protein